MTLELSSCWRCETCGAVVLDDGRGFIYSEGKVRRCNPPELSGGYCDSVKYEEAGPILTNAEVGNE